MNHGVQPDTEWEEDISNAGKVFDPEVVRHRMLQNYPLTKKLWYKWPEFTEKVFRRSMTTKVHYRRRRILTWMGLIILQWMCYHRLLTLLTTSSTSLTIIYLATT